MNKSEILIEVLEDLTWDIYPELVDKLMKFNRSTIDDEIERQASIYSYYYGLMCVAKRKVDEYDQDATRAAANARRDAKFSTKSKLTAKDLDDVAFADPIYEKALENLRDYREKYGMLKGIVSSLEQKKDMLIQLSANARAETNLYRK